MIVGGEPPVPGGPVIGRAAQPRPRVADAVPPSGLASVAILVHAPGGGAAGDAASAGGAAAGGGAVARSAAAIRAALDPYRAPWLPDLDAVLARDPLSGRAGEVVSVPRYGDGPRAVYLVGTGGAAGDVGGAGGADHARGWRAAGAALGRRLASDGAGAGAGDSAVIVPPDASADLVAALVRSLQLAGYRYRLPAPAVPAADVRAGGDVVTGDAAAAPGRRLLLVPSPDAPAAARDALSTAVATAAATSDAVWLARDLANTPADTKSPAWMAQVAQELAGDPARRLSVQVRDTGWLREHGFGGLLAVGAGSVRPPYLVELRYRPPAPARRRVVLVGKGITFDSGGLSIKPLEAMTLMKTDMAGGAAVIATLSAAAAAGVGVEVTALVPLADNMPSGSAMRPGDVVRHPNGLTTEIRDTDAEGRLVLADALAYATVAARPDAVVDVATLTGAIRLALGRRIAGLFTPDDALAAGLARAAAASGEQVWRMPLAEEYRDALASDVADQGNITRERPGPGAGATLAALFLSRFVPPGLPWAHLDIAGTGRADADDGEITKGATGYGVRLLLAWLAGLG